MRPGNQMDIRMAFQGLDQPPAEAIWRPFFDWVVAAMPDDFAHWLGPTVRSVAAQRRWDPAFLKAYLPPPSSWTIAPRGPADNVFWAANLAEAGHFIFGYESPGAGRTANVR